MTNINQTVAEIRGRDGMYPDVELTAGAVQDRRTLLNIIDQLQGSSFDVTADYIGEWGGATPVGLICRRCEVQLIGVEYGDREWKVPLARLIHLATRHECEAVS